MLPQLPVAQKVIHERLKNQTYQDIPKLLRGLKIIFAEQVTADEFGRLSFVAQPPLDKPLPLPDRSLAA
jgi:hypothetical protein